jgi:predicted PhzF superfamily epimerase YddE/YHI9
MNHSDDFIVDYDYGKEDVAHDLYLMVKAGLIDIKIREDGEWLYSASEKSKSLTEEELEQILSNLSED